MKYLNTNSTTYHQDRLKSLDILERLIDQSVDEGGLRESILAKIEGARKLECSKYVEAVQPDGSVLVRHPAIAVIELDHFVLDVPKQLFGNPCKSLSAYRFTVSRAEVIISPEGVFRYIPYEAVSQFMCSERSFTSMIIVTSDDVPVSLERMKGLEIETEIPSLFEADGAQAVASLYRANQNISTGFTNLISELEGAAEKLVNSASHLPLGYVNNSSYAISTISRHASHEAMSLRLEVESFTAMRQSKEDQ
jgi:hypothetical protein